MSEVHAALAAHGHEHHPRLQHHFDSLEQQLYASTFGMWVFLVTEVLFFGGLFMAYIVYRIWYPEMFVAASHKLSIPLGTFNTAVLIGSSLTMALAVWGAQGAKRKFTTLMLVMTLVLGGIFVGVKGYEYWVHIEHGLFPGAQTYTNVEATPQLTILTPRPRERARIRDVTLLKPNWY